MKSRNIIALFALMAWCGVANATFHLWDISEVYSNADGSVQFVELISSASGQQFTGGERITANSDGSVVTFTFPSNTGSPTNGHRLLLGSPGFAGEAGAVTPDFTLPASFFDPDANSIVINFVGAVGLIAFSSSDLPTDGVLSLNKNLSTGTNSPTNFSGQSGQLTGQQPQMFTIGGNVTGLSGTGLVLRNNGGDNLAIGGNGVFTFATPLTDGSNYAVTVFTQPSNLSQTCTVGNGSGTLAGTNVTNVAVTCATDANLGFQINPGLNGSWANFDTLGQGFFIDVFPDIPLFFLAWFTWEVGQQAPAQNQSSLQQPGSSGSKLLAVVGDDNHRWLTAQGPFANNTAPLDVTLTTGGLFDNPQPTDNSEMGTYGTMTVTFTDCKNGTVDYNFTAIGLSGSVPIQRLAEDNVALCETMDGIGDDPQ